MTLGQKIKKLRGDRNLTQKDLADQVHVTFQTVSKWENDENEPDVATLRELSKLFGCTMDYLLSEEEVVDEPVQEIVEKPAETPVVEQVTKTIIIHQKELHVCRRCNKDIPEDELYVEKLTKRERHGRSWSTVPAGEAFYHKTCWDEVVAERAAQAARERADQAHRGRVKCFGWGIAAGAIALIASLLIMLIGCKDTIHPGLAILNSALISYFAFAMIYCIVSGSYIGEVFVWCAGASIKFPGLIFSWSIEGFIWVIAMKILFAIIGFIFGLFALVFGILLSAALGGISFPFVLIHNIHTNYDDCL